MITYKYKIQNIVDITKYLKPYNNVVRYAYNRFREIPDISIDKVVRIVQKNMHHIELFDFTLIRYAVNNYRSFLIAPNGFKMQDLEFRIYSRRRASFVKWLREQIGLDWVEVQYGDDLFDNKIINDSCGVFMEEKKRRSIKRKRNTARERLKSIERQNGDN